MSMVRPPKLPGSYLVIELTNRCSLACVHCSVSETDHPHHRETGFLDPGLAEGLFDDLVEVGARFDTLILFWLGEPLLHPEFGQIWRRAVRVGAQHGTFGKVEVHTNATHLSERRIRTVLNDAKLSQVWHFSLDSIQRDTYHRVKGVDRFDKVQANVARFLDEKQALDARWPRPVFQFIVGSNNVSEVPAFRRHWEDACKSRGLPVRAAAGHVPAGDDAIVFFRQLDCPTAAEQERENAIFREAMANEGLLVPVRGAQGGAIRAENHTVCSAFWKSPVISWQGEVTTCTRDNLLENRVGSLRDERFSALWWGNEMRRRRQAVSQGNYEGLVPCSTCFIPTSLNYTELSRDDIARQQHFDSACRWA